MCRPYLIIRKSCYFDFRVNKPFTPRCFICVLCSFHMISTYYLSYDYCHCHCTTCPKDHGLFYVNYPQINEVRKADRMDRTVSWLLIGTNVIWLNFIQSLAFPCETHLYTMHTHAHTQTHARTHAHTHAHTHTHTHARTRTRTRAHAHAHSLKRL